MTKKILIIEDCSQCFPQPIDCGAYLVCLRVENTKHVIPRGTGIPIWCPLDEKES